MRSLFLLLLEIVSCFFSAETYASSFSGDPANVTVQQSAYSRIDTLQPVVRNSSTGYPPYEVGEGITPKNMYTVRGVDLTIPTAYAFADPDGGALTYILGGITTDGLTIDAGSGIITGRPPMAGLFGITVVATDNEGNRAYSGFYLHVKNAAGITSPQSAMVGIPFSTTTAGAFYGSQNGYLTFSSGSLPLGLTLDATSGLISGVPANPGRFGITVAARNKQTDAVEYNGFYLDVALNPAINLPPYVLGIGLSSPKSVTVNTPISISTASSFGDPEGRPLTFTSSPLPVGLSLNPTTGVLSGTPTLLGQWGITIGATDDGGHTIYSGFYLLVNTDPPTNLPPVIIGGLQTPLIRLSGAFLSIPTAYAFSDPEGRPLSYSSSSLPSGLNLDSNTGIISGKVLGGGRYGITIGATDDGGSTTYSGFFLTINLPPYVVGEGLSSPVSATVGVPISIATAYAFADPEGRPFTYTSSNLARGLSLNATTGVISGTPISPIRAGITVVATDDGGASVSSGFYLLTEGQTIGGARVNQADGQDEPMPLRVVVFGNPVLTEEANLEIGGINDEPLSIRCFDSQGRHISSLYIDKIGSPSVFVKAQLGKPSGLYYVQVTTPSRQRAVSILKQ
ncbi:putative Ig domain-containing protein [Fibrella sp. WM1]|uniref:putative Ig domain-containing protein n=1 Tax=Fibrella musci TaxID=3242485 RepID=UPI00352235A0